MKTLIEAIMKANQKSNTVLSETQSAVRQLAANNRWTEEGRAELRQKLAREQQVKLDEIFDDFQNAATLPEQEHKQESADFAARTYYATVAANTIQGADGDSMLRYFEQTLAGGNEILIHEAEQLLQYKLKGADLARLDEIKHRNMSTDDRREMGRRAAYADVSGRVPSLRRAAAEILQAYARGEAMPNNFNYTFGFTNALHSGAKDTYEAVTREKIDLTRYSGE